MRSARLRVVTIWLVLAACGRSPSAPSAGQSVPAPGAAATVTAVRVSGPVRVAPGETVAYTATATYSDGSSKDVSAEAAWSPSSPSMPLYFSAPGTAVGVHAGEAMVFARVGALQGSTAVLVLEKGTFKLSGRVVEAGDRPLEGVSVDVVAGVGSGLHALANPRGEYSLYGVAGQIQLRVSGEGFIPQLRDLAVNADGAAEPFTLVPREAPAAGVAGAWTMTLTPSRTCSAAPEDIAVGRSYHMEITQRGTGLAYTISGPTITAYNPQLNTGNLFGARVKLYFVGDTGYGDWSTGDIIDRLSPHEMMQFNGTLEGIVDRGAITGTLSGDIVYWDDRHPSFVPNWYCRATDHAVTLRQ